MDMEVGGRMGPGVRVKSEDRSGLQIHCKMKCSS